LGGGRGGGVCAGGLPPPAGASPGVPGGGMEPGIRIWTWAFIRHM